MAASHGSVMTAAKCRNDRPAAANASRFVRFDTGSSSDALLARCAVAYACGLAGTANVRAVASTTGVSRTTVASRLRIAVVADAMTNTMASRCRGLPALNRAIATPAARNRPSSSHNRANTRIAARKPTTGSSWFTSASASDTEMTPVAMSVAAAGIATIASGQPCGRMMANSSTTASATSARVNSTGSRAARESADATRYRPAAPAGTAQPS